MVASDGPAPTRGLDAELMAFVPNDLSPEDRAIVAAPFPPALTQELIPGPWRELWGPMAAFLLE